MHIIALLYGVALLYGMALLQTVWVEFIGTVGASNGVLRRVVLILFHKAGCNIGRRVRKHP